MFRKISLILIPVVIISLAMIFLGAKNNSNQTMTASGDVIRYVAIGDSYTIGLGVLERERWPNVLVENLKKAGVNVELVANPAVSGYTVLDAIEAEIPMVSRVKPDLVTVLIGANDNFSRTEVETYRQELKRLLDELQPQISNPKNIVLITIPDYTRSPAAAGYEISQKNEISKSIDQYNQVIKDEAKDRDLKVADLFPLSQTMTTPSDFISDGLHPSGQGYLKWEKVIFPVVFSLIKRT